MIWRFPFFLQNNLEIFCFKLSELFSRAEYMEALFNQITHAINEQNTRLRAEINVRGVPITNEAGQGTEEPTAANSPEDPNPSVSLNATHIMERLKVILPIIVLILVKLLIDNFIAGSALIMSVSSLYRLRQAFDLEIALKDRSSKFTVFVLLLFSTALLGCILIEIDSFDYFGNVWHRLQFKQLPIDTKVTFLQTLWSCGITDMIVQLMVLCVKLAVVNGISAYTQLHKFDWQHFACLKLRQSSTNSADIEAGGAHHHSHSHSHSTADISTLQAFSNFGNSISGLVRRQISTIGAAAGSGNNSSHSHAYSSIASADSSSASGGAMVPVVDALLGGSEAGTVNSSDSEGDDADPGRESRQFLLKMRACSLLDVLGLVYRSALPMPWWVAYFRGTVAVALVLQILYVAIKISDLALKVRGAGVVIHLFFYNKIEFGHYSTEEELQERRESSCECPVCFDNPRNPVTLDCHHIFCEACILEWLEKEHTCPVCRAQVDYCNPVLRDIKLEASSAVPALI